MIKEERCRQQIYKNQSERIEVEQRNALVEMKLNRTLIVHSQFSESMSIANKNFSVLFNDEITSKITNKVAVAATNAAFEDKKIGGSQMISDKCRKINAVNKAHYKKQSGNSAVEVTILLELIKVIE